MSLLLVSLLSSAVAGGPVPDAVDAMVVQQIDAIQADDSSAWDDATETILVGVYDLDKSGAIDTTTEVAAVPCHVWAALDRGTKMFYSSGVWVVYGFGAGYGWVGSALGFGEPLRVQAADAIAACGYGGTALEEPDDDAGGGSDDVDDVIEAKLLGAYDADGSGRLEKKEAKAIPCDVLRDVDAAVRGAWDGTGVRVIHGFEKDLIWVGYALGFADNTRGSMRKRFQQCGVSR